MDTNLSFIRLSTSESPTEWTVVPDSKSTKFMGGVQGCSDTHARGYKGGKGEHEAKMLFNFWIAVDDEYYQELHKRERLPVPAI
jgi:hypothetical protein